MQAIILAGGFGTRLQSVLKDIPKPMAPVAGKPFLEYIIRYLSSNGVSKIILSVGYLHEVIYEYFKSDFEDTKIIYSIETKPLGTGGAIKAALPLTDENEILIINGDTYFDVSLQQFYSAHNSENAFMTMALKQMYSFDRYGIVGIDSNNHITSFIEKNYFESGMINGGVYILDKKRFMQISLPEVFSFEKDFLEKYYNNDFYGFVSDSYFIDIGIPEDYIRAQNDFERFNY